MPAEKLSTYQKGVIWMLISASSFGFLGIFVKFAYEEGINSLTLLFLRYAFASIMLFSYIKFKHLNLFLKKKDLMTVLALGVFCYSGQAFGFFQALRYLSAGVTTLMLYTYPIFVTLVALYVLKERVTRKIVIALGSVLIGVFLIVYSREMEINLVGVTWILGTSFVNSIYITLSKLTLKNFDPRVMGFYIMLSTACVSFIAGVSTGTLQVTLRLEIFLFSLLIALVPTVIAIVTFFNGLKLIGASRASIISTFEPVVTVTLGFLLLGEILSLPQLCGGVLILTSVIILGKENR